MEKTRLSPFAYGILKKCDENGIELAAGGTFLLAVSGGRDSAALVPLFREFQDRFGLAVHVGYVDHGPTADEALQRYRRLARARVEELARANGWPFLTNSGGDGPRGSDEAALRTFRRERLAEWRRQTRSEYVVSAHHADDLLETRLIRLLRGTGPHGLEAMSMRDGFLLRPFLELSRARVHEYAEACGFAGLDDPSNGDERFLRNWLRNRLLPQIESYRPGSTQTLSRSLSQLATEVKRSAPQAPATTHGQCEAAVIPRSELAGRPRSAVQDILYRFVSRAKLLNLSTSQLHEAAKRLDTERKNLRFQVGPYLWTANAEQVTVKALVEPRAPTLAE